MPSAPLDLVFSAITIANTRLNGKVETLQPIGGQVIGNTNAFSQQVVNSAWRKLQNKLADMRYAPLQIDTVFLEVPPTGNLDPVAQAYMNFSNYYDGATLWDAPVLPQNLIRPWELTERASGSEALFTDMDPIPWSLPRVAKSQWNRQWLWKNNTIYLPGSTLVTDIAMLYSQLLGDFLDVGSTQWFQQTIPILNCLDALADYICREIAIARGDMEGAAAFQASAEGNAMLLVHQDSTQGKSILTNAQYQRMADGRTPNVGPDTQQVKR
jgi:hypothetical protein